MQLSYPKFLHTTAVAILLLSTIQNKLISAATDEEIAECKADQKALFGNHSDIISSFGTTYLTTECAFLGFGIIGGALNIGRDKDVCTFEKGDDEETVSFDVRANYAQIWNGEYDDDDETYEAYKNMCEDAASNARMCALSMNITVTALSDSGNFDINMELWHLPVCTVNSCSEEEAVIIVQQEALNKAKEALEQTGNETETQTGNETETRRARVLNVRSTNSRKPAVSSVRHLAEGEDICADLDLTSLESFGVQSLSCVVDTFEFHCEEEDIKSGVERVPTLLSSSSFSRSATTAVVWGIGILAASVVAM